MFSTDPGGDDFSPNEMEKQGRLLTDEKSGPGPFFGEVGVFAQLRVAPRFFEAGDALNAVDGVRIKNVVVAYP